MAHVRTILATLTALLLAVLLAGCGGGEGVDVDGEGSGSEGGGEGGMLTAAIAGEPDNLDPHNTSAYFSFQVLENVYDTLVEPDENLEMRAVDRRAVDDQRGPADLDLHDPRGRDVLRRLALTAEDVAYRYNRIIDEELDVVLQVRLDVKSIKATDPQTLESSR